ncbi:antimicrobial peptide resistance and lipid A acylation PagP family protein [Collimonas fungivorans]|jgi:palmitoyl transferase|uniref:Antimicrobial peptide resistance and lipid A acylation PagP family protein n=1 Tax=Collimonas fungivorans TaxID=158899 RepID=A0A127P706_9BURK|nr:antimicrobial peptide resistance and lipid A acylation PagP family protein [Collimonas fungivorans]
MTTFYRFSALKRIALLTCMTALVAMAAPVQAQETPDTTGWFSKTLTQTQDRLSNIANNGDMEVYLSGYAYHGRRTYTEEKLRELNEKAWGLGGGRTIRNADGNDESLYLFAIRDSHRKPQIMAGYAYEWIWNVPKTPVEVGAGYTAMLMSRQDYFGGFPFPIALPVVSLGVKGAKLMGSYVPRLSQNKGNGDVWLIFARFEVK